MDVVFAVTGLDEKNLLASLLTKQLGARKIISRANRNAYITPFEMVGVDRAVSPGQVTGDAVLELTTGVEDVVTLRDEKVELIDFTVSESSRAVGRSIAREMPRDSTIGIILRDGRPLNLDRDWKVQTGDDIIILALQPAISKVRKLFAAKG
jgi:trk system potassium uptake protein TrkA